MARDDAARWNERYRSSTQYHTKTARQLLKDHIHLLPSSGLALDVAAGLGHDSYLLARHGLTVYGIDIAFEALRKVKRKCPELRLFLADLEEYPITGFHPDVITNFYYYQPSLLPRLINSLRPGGFFLFETFTQPMLQIKPELNPAHLVDPGDFSNLTSNLDIIFMHDGWDESNPDKPRYTYQLVGRKKG
ncbi:MAG: class I SAM-dependent methyltransferase [bacterium]